MRKLKCYATYQGSLDAERHREKQWRSTKQGKFESSFVSFEVAKEAFYPLGAAVSRPFYQDPEEESRAAKTAKQRVSRNIPECHEVFTLILKNGKNRPKSVWEMVDEIKSQGGALKKEHSTMQCTSDTNDTSPKSANSSGSNTTRKRKTKRRRKRRNLPHYKKS